MRAFFLILASAALVAPVAAAEIGVRHTTGHTTSTVSGGRSTTHSFTNGSYAEVSRGGSGGHGGGSGFTRVETGNFGSRTNESFNFGSHSTSNFSESSTFSR